MKRKLIIVTVVMLLCSLVVGLAYAKTIDENVTGYRNLPYNYPVNGSYSTLTAESKKGDSASPYLMPTRSVIKNTSSSTQRVSVSVQEYNTRAGVYEQEGSQQNFTLTAGASVGTDYINRHASSSNTYYYIHKATVNEYTSSKVLDSYKLTMIH